jgi:excisionase family DNA binding protein
MTTVSKPSDSQEPDGTSRAALAGDQLLNIDEVSDWLRIPKSTLYKLCGDGEIPAAKIEENTGGSTSASFPIGCKPRACMEGKKKSKRER